MSCKGYCKRYPARRLSTNTGSIYSDNFRCYTCKKYVPPSIVEKNKHGQLICRCCNMQVRSKSRRKLKLMITN